MFLHPYLLPTCPVCGRRSLSPTLLLSRSFSIASAVLATYGLTDEFTATVSSLRQRTLADPDFAARIIRFTERIISHSIEIDDFDTSPIARLRFIRIQKNLMNVLSNVLSRTPIRSPPKCSIILKGIWQLVTNIRPISPINVVSGSLELFASFQRSMNTGPSSCGATMNGSTRGTGQLRTV